MARKIISSTIIPLLMSVTPDVFSTNLPISYGCKDPTTTPHAIASSSMTNSVPSVSSSLFGSSTQSNANGADGPQVPTGFHDQNGHGSTLPTTHAKDTTIYPTRHFCIQANNKVAVFTGYKIGDLQ